MEHSEGSEIPTRILGAHRGTGFGHRSRRGSSGSAGSSEPESIRIIRTAIDNGITFLDNCWDYNEGRSEVRMGKALRNGYRGAGIPDDKD